MSVLKTLRPVGDNGGAGDWTLSGGGSAGGVLQDDNIPSGLVCAVDVPPYPKTGEIILGPAGLPPGARVLWVQVRAQAARSSETGVVLSSLYDAAHAASMRETFRPTADGAQHEVSGAQFARNPATNADWDAEVQNLLWFAEAGSTLFPADGTLVTVNELYIDVLYKRQHTVDVAPVNTASAVPLVSWTVTAPDNTTTPQDRARVLVFPSSVYTRGGFQDWLDGVVATWNRGETADLSKYPPTYDSDVILSSTARSHQIGKPVVDTKTYRAYVLANQPWSGSRKRWYVYDYAQWTVDLVPLNTPTLVSLVADDDTATMIVTPASGYVSGFPGAATFRYERSIDAGLTWTTVIAGLAVDAVLGDSAAPLGVAVMYHVRAESVDNISEWSNTLENVLHIDSFWLKDAADPSRSQKVKVVAFKPKRTEPVGDDDVLGDDKAVVVTDGPKAWRGTMTIQTESKAEWDALNVLLDSGRVLLIQDALGNQWYARVTGDREHEQLRSIPDPDEWRFPVRHLYRVTFPWAEVRKP